MLRRAHAHRGTAFIEILQNCPVYNDDEWIEVEDRKQRVEASLKLEDGKPLVYGPPGDIRGIRIEDGVPSVVELTDPQDPVSAGVAVHHDRHDMSTGHKYASPAAPEPDQRRSFCTARGHEMHAPR